MRSPDIEKCRDFAKVMRKRSELIRVVVAERRSIAEQRLAELALILPKADQHKERVDGVPLELRLEQEEFCWRATHTQRQSLRLVWEGAFRRGSFTHMDFDTWQQRVGGSFRSLSMVVENTLNKAIAQKMYRVQDIQAELHDLFQLARQARNRAHSTRRAARTMIEKCQQTRHTRARDTSRLSVVSKWLGLP